MLRQTAQLYDPMIERDSAATRDAVTALCAAESPAAVLDAVARFAVLAFCPSQHSKAALCATVAAKELLGEYSEDAAALIAECAIYAADSRAPWSEPPISDPPALEPEQSSELEEVQSAIAEKDRLRAERWLASALERDDFAQLFFDASLLTLPAGEQGVIVAAAAWRIAQSVPRAHWFATLRVAVNDWTHEGLFTATAPPEHAGASAVLQQIVSVYEAEQASPLAFQAVALFDAGYAMKSVAPDAHDAVIRHLAAHRTESAERLEVGEELPRPIYPLARDYAGYLQSAAMRSRLRAYHDDAVLMRAMRLALHNLEHADTYEEWSFA